MSKFLFVTKEGLSLALAKRVEEEGHSVSVFDFGNNFPTLLKREESFANGLLEAPYIVFDFVGMGPAANQLIKNGYKVFGASGFHDNLSLDASFALKIAEGAGLKIATDDEGTELFTECWYSKGKPILPIFSYIENRSFMPDNAGAEIDCASILYWPYDTDSPKSYFTTLAKMEKILKGVEYTGPLAIKTIINLEDNKPYFAGFRAGLRPSVYALIELFQEHISNLIIECCEERDDSIFVDYNNYGTVATISYPPYPNQNQLLSYSATSGKTIDKCRSNLLEIIKEEHGGPAQFNLDFSKAKEGLNNLKSSFYVPTKRSF